MKKRILTALFTMLACLCLCFGLAACGVSSVGGTYYLYENGALNKDKFITLKGGKWTDENSDSGEYEIDGDKIVIYTEFFGEKVEFTSGTVKSGELFLEMGGANVHYYKEGCEPGASNNSGGNNTPSDPSVKEYNVTFVLNYFGARDIIKSTEDGLVAYIPEREGYVFNGWWLSDGQTASGEYILAQKWDTSEKVTEEGLVLIAEWVEKSTVSSQLSAPSVTIQDNKFSWQAVSGAVSYDVRIINSYTQEEMSRDTVQGTSWVFPSSFDAGYYNVKIRAMGDGETTVNSVYVIKSYGHRILNAVSDISFDITTSVLTWTAVKNATSYVLYVDGAEVETLTYTTFDFSDYEAGEYLIKIAATRSGYQSSTVSKTINKLRLKTPSFTISSDENRINYTVAWQPVNHADTYTVTTNGSEHRVTGGNSYTFDRTAAGWGDVENIAVSVTASDSEADYLKSTPSPEQTVKRAYLLTVTVSDEEAGSVSAVRLGRAPGEEVVLKATTNKGYTWLGWYKGGEEVATSLDCRYIMIKGNATLEAHWILCPVTVRSGDENAGSVSGLPNATFVGQEITLTAKTNQGYTFIGWYKGEDRVTRELTYLYTMTKEIVTLEARWIECPINVQSNGTGGTVTFPDTTVLGEEAVLNATAFLGYIFDGWYKDGNQVSTESSMHITVEAKKATYEARWTIDPALSDFKYNLTRTTCTITGVNDLAKAEYIIPDYVTEIKGGAFKGCNSIRSMTIPFVGGSRKTANDTYQYPLGYIFGTSSFSGASAVTQYYYGNSTSSTTNTTYYIPDSLKNITVTGGRILYGAFYNCSGLESVTIETAVTSIGKSAFLGCSGLTSITIPDSVTEIWSSSFSGCSGLTGVYITDLSAWCKIDFCRDGMLGLFWTANPLYYAHHLYVCNKEVKELIIPNEITHVKQAAFYGCTGLTNVTIGDSVTSIGEFAFGGCGGLTSVTIGDSVTSIGYYAFLGCSGLTSITIPDNVTSIGEDAFYSCSGLESVTIGSGVTSIGSEAFRYCGELLEIKVDTNNPKYHVDGNCLIETESKTLIVGCKTSKIPDGGSVITIGNYAFQNCSGLAGELKIPDSVTSIGESAFYGCSGLESVTIGGGSIGDRAFYNCSGLQSVTIGSGVTSIGEDAFAGCGSIQSMTIPFVGGSRKTANDTYQYPLGYIFGTSSFSGASAVTQYYYGNSTSSTTNTTYYIPDSLKNITVTGGDILYGAFEDCSGLENVTIGSGVTSIGKSAFYNCSGLAGELKIPDSVTSIGSYAFYGCSGLQNLTIGGGSIGDQAFYNCSGLQSVTIGSGVTSIGRWAFSGCGSIQSITIPFVGDSRKTANDAGQYPFGYLFGTASFTGASKVQQYYYDSSRTYEYYYIPDSLKSVAVTGGEILYGAFYNCSGLENVTIGSSVTSIGEYAFYNCSGLQNVTIGNSVTSIGSSTFDGCSGLEWFDVAEENANYSSQDRILYNKGKTAIIAVPRAIKGAVTIPDSVTSIGSGAFRGCSSIQSMTIPFVGGSRKTANDTYQYPFGYLFGTWSFSGASRVTQYYYGNSISSTTCNDYYIPDSLKSVTVTGGEILYGAFYGCSGLTSVTIGSGVTSIGDYAFYYCSGLQCVYYKGTPEEWKSVSIGSDNTGLTYAAKYYFSDVEPDEAKWQESENWWHYDGVTGEIAIWEKKS